MWSNRHYDRNFVPLAARCSDENEWPVISRLTNGQLPVKILTHNENKLNILDKKHCNLFESGHHFKIYEKLGATMLGISTLPLERH